MRSAKYKTKSRERRGRHIGPRGLIGPIGLRRGQEKSRGYMENMKKSYIMEKVYLGYNPTSVKYIAKRMWGTKECVR